MSSLLASIKRNGSKTTEKRWKHRFPHYKSMGARTKFLVIKGKINSPPLISKNTLIELGMLQIKEDGSFANQNDMRIPGEILDIRTVTTNRSQQAIQEITNKFSSVFESIGKTSSPKGNDRSPESNVPTSNLI